MGANDRRWAGLRFWHKRMTGPEMREQLDGPPVLFSEIHRWSAEEMEARLALLGELGPSPVEVAERPGHVHRWRTVGMGDAAAFYECSVPGCYATRDLENDGPYD